MKSPSQLAQKLAKQWQNTNLRLDRLLAGVLADELSNVKSDDELSDADWSDVKLPDKKPPAFPIELTIGLPSATQVTEVTQTVREHVLVWQEVNVGEVVWVHKSYRGLEEAIKLPKIWRLNNPSEWIAACADKRIQAEFNKLSQVFDAIYPLLINDNPATKKSAYEFMAVFVRQRQLISQCDATTLIQVAKLALSLDAGCAKGLPLRALSLVENDTKFFERHSRLITQLLDVRFDGKVSQQGLPQFLGASIYTEHWLLVLDLGCLGDTSKNNDKTQACLQGVEQLRMRGHELGKLAQLAPNCKRVIVVENEQCLYQLPALSYTIAIMGTGFNLSWLASPWFANKQVAYWGDIDTWGLYLLALAKKYLPSITPLLMSAEIYDKHINRAVVEPKPQLLTTHLHYLSTQEFQLFNRLLTAKKGRLEQEFLPVGLVYQEIQGWVREN